MNDDLEPRILALEKYCLSLEAGSLFQTQAVGVLLALIEYNAEKRNPLTKVSSGEIRRFYTKTLREETEKFLANLADDRPVLATELRELLKEQLDKD